MSTAIIEKARILAVDDNQDALFALENLLKMQDFVVATATDGNETLEKLKSFSPDLVLLDIQMPEPDGYQVTKIIKSDPKLRYTIVVLLTAKDNLEDVVFGLEQGADDYIKKPFRSEELLARVNSALRLKQTFQQIKERDSKISELQRREAERSRFADIIGKSPEMQDVFSLIEKVADSEVPVLISGESGTGKELVARALHYQSSRKDKIFMVLNCSAFNDNLLESELFGHVRGAFSGAVRDKKGLFEIADGGTFFLDELGEMSQALQAKLLRVVQEGTFIPVGSTAFKKVDVRIVAATHRNLRDMVTAGNFREDLYYRLNVVNIKLPALRERVEDIPLLVEHFLREIAAKKQQSKKTLKNSVMKLMCSYHWPGNIRELQNELERIILLSSEESDIDESYLSAHIKSAQSSAVPSSLGNKKHVSAANLNEAIELLEKEMILKALQATDWNKSEAAKNLGISRTSLIAKVQEYGLEKK